MHHNPGSFRAQRCFPARRAFPQARLLPGLLASLGLVTALLTRPVLSSAAEPPAAVSYASAIHRLEQLVSVELAAGHLHGVSLALVDDQRLVYAKGFGLADARRRRPARADTVYRAGSISKLFTALAAMQLVEQGRLDLDAPVTAYDPAFRIVNPFPDSPPITLRQLMCHRAGLIREAPVGGYFDASEPGVEQTVRSIAACALVYPPNTKTKYSNVGPTVVGHVVATVAGLPFEAHQRRHLLGPLGLEDSDFRLTRRLKTRLATAYLPVADGRGGFREREAPHFELGTLPAGNLYTTAEDLARFLAFLFAEGRVNGRPLLKPESLAEMFTVQLTGATNGFGLGFYVGQFNGRRSVSHTGAVYGFTSALTALPDQKIGVVVLGNDDLAVGPVRRLNTAALEWMLEAKFGEPPPARPPALALTRAALESFAGEFESESFWAVIEPAASGLLANISNQRMTLTPTAPWQFEADGRLVFRAPFVFTRDETGAVTGFTALGQRFRRVTGVPAEIPAAWRQFLGRYGPDFIPVIITARHGHLYAMTENEFDYRLTPLNRTVFRMPAGLYVDEHLVFQTDRHGRVHGLILANMTLPRRGR